MEMPSFLQSKQTTSPDDSSNDRKKRFGVIVLAVLLFAIPLTVWLAQRAQIFNPRAAGGPIELVSGADSCVVSADTNKVSCGDFPIKLTSPLGPPASPSPQNEPTPTPSPVVTVSPSSGTACTTTALSKTSNVDSASSLTYVYTYPTSTKIVSVNFPAQNGVGYAMNGQISQPGQALNMNLGAGQSSIQFTILPTACTPFTAPFTMVNNCGTTMSDFVGIGSVTAYGSYCAASPSPSAIIDVEPSPTASKTPAPAGSTTGVSSGTDTLGVNLQSQGICQGGFPIVLFSNQGRSDTNNFRIYRDGQPLNYTFAGPFSRPPVTQMKDTGLNLSTTYAYYIQAVDGPLAGQRSNVSTVSTPNNCPVTGMNWFQRLVEGVYPKLITEVYALDPPLIDNGLVSEWKFDEVSGNIAVDSKGVSNGTATSAEIVDGKFNKARQIGISNSNVIAADKPAYASDYFTVAGWVKPQSFGVGNFVSIFSRRDANNTAGLTLEYSGYEDAGNGQLQCVVFLVDSPGSTRVANTQNAKLTLNQWNHVACSYDGATVKVYINGTLAGSTVQSGKLKNGSGLEIKMGQNPFHPTNALNGTLDQMMYWNRALSDSEVSALANLTSSPTVSPTVTPSPTPNGPGTVSFKVAETEDGLVNATVNPYTSNGLIYDFAFTTDTPGVRQIWVEFIGADGSTEKEHISVEIVEPDPVLTSVDCSLDLSGQNLKVTLNGSRLGTSNGKVTVDSKESQIVSWSTGQVIANIKPEGNLENGKLYKVVLTKSDSKILPEVSCQVGTTLISLGARLFCREPGKFDINGVKVTLVDEDGNKVDEEVTVDSAGVIKNLKTKLQVGKLYAISVKAPYSLRKNAQFSAANGTNVITPDDGKPFILPVGDIAPVILQDGKINTLDRSEIVRQWSVLGSGTKTGDFNRDTKVNSIDWACMRFDFNAEDEAIPTRATPTQPSPVPSFAPSVNPGTGASSSPQASVSVSPSPQASAGRSAFFLIQPVGSGSFILDDEFIVDIKISSAVEAANLFSAKISFDPTALEVSRIQKGTALTSWVEEAINNQVGTLALTAGIPTPGLKTEGDTTPTMARIIFKSKKIGPTNIIITDASRIFSNANNVDILKEYASQSVAIVGLPGL